MAKLYIGQTVTRQPKSFGTLDDKPRNGMQKPPRKKYQGVVVYLHPKGRFHTVEYTFQAWGGGINKIRESYAGVCE